jgi:hypothetical protein
VIEFGVLDRLAAAHALATAPGEPAPSPPGSHVTLEARVGSWSELEVSEATSRLELDVAAARVRLEHRHPTWRPLEPERVELRLLEPLP